MELFQKIYKKRKCFLNACNIIFKYSKNVLNFSWKSSLLNVHLQAIIVEVGITPNPKATKGKVVDLETVAIRKI